MILFDYSIIERGKRRIKKPPIQSQIQLQLIQMNNPIQSQPKQTPRQSAQSYSSHHTQSFNSHRKESSQNVPDAYNLVTRNGLYEKSVYQSPGVVNRASGKKHFQSCFREDIIIEFYSAYLPLTQLQPYLHLIEKIYNYYHREMYRDSHDSVYLQCHSPCRKQRKCYWHNWLRLSDRYCLQVGFDNYQKGQKKYEMFLKFKLASILYDWNLLVNVLQQISESYNQQIELKIQDRCQRRHYIKQIIRIMFTNLSYMIDYIKLNQDTFYYLRKKLTKYLMPRITYLRLDNKTVLVGFASKQRKCVRSEYRRETVRNAYDSQSSLVSQVIQTQSQNQQYAANNAQRKISKLFDVLNAENISNSSYKQFFYCMESSIKDLFQNITSSSNIQKTQKLQAYSTVAKKTQSHKNHFLMGLYIGLGSITLIALFILLIFGLVQLDYDEEKVDSLNYIFPMFRGIGLLILYLWGVAWNVYGFTKYRINHRLILQYGSHYSTHFQVMKRAGFFTLVFSLMLLVYIVIQSMDMNEVQMKRVYLVEYTPFVVWVLYFSYIFFPNRDVFNAQGRRYFYDLLMKIFFSPIIKVTFLITWASDQAVSFVIPIKDFAYTICFYTSDVSLESVKNCLSSSHFQGAIVTYIVAILPLLLRMIQCYKQAKQQSGRFIGHLQMWNFCKYLSSVITATSSYLSTIFPEVFTVFVISSVISTSYSYYWDLKNDWGFLEKNSKYRFLRSHLSYKNPTIYYIAITTNLLFRCAWTLTISASIVAILHKSTFLPFLTGFIQIFRRCMWNFFRVEKQHLANCKDYVIMKPSVQKLVQKLKKKQREARIQSLEPHFEVQLGYSQQVKKQYIESMRQQQNLINLFGKKDYEQEWENMTPAKIETKKAEFLQLLQREKSIFKEYKSLVAKKFPDLEDTVY